MGMRLVHYYLKDKPMSSGRNWAYQHRVEGLVMGLTGC